MDSVLTNIAATFMYATPIILAALGGIYCERSGATNIALEGIMLVGAFVAACIAYYLGSNISDSTSFYATTIVPWISVIAGAVVGLIFSILHAVAGTFSSTRRATSFWNARWMRFLSSALLSLLTSSRGL